ncbi:MAG: aminotransferase class I/II-fold pyridoxal phosphate-dependent enzyme [Actinomycetota bacterium]
MEQPPILLSAPDVGQAERDALLAAFDSGWIAPAGPDLDRFEEELVSYTEAPAAVALSSGTAALHLALLLAGVGPGDEVVVQSATFAASAFAVAHLGASPVFCDSESATWCLDPEPLADFLERRSRIDRLPAAVMPVDLYGSAADYAQIAEVCERFGVAIVRDAAEALGSIGDAGHVGAEPCLTALSFNGNKIITASSGGALLGTQDQVDRARYLSTQARQPVLHYEHIDVGFNYRLSNLLAALGRAQLAQIERRIERRAQIAEHYAAAFPEFGWCPYGCTGRPNHWLSVALLPSGDPLAICDVLHTIGVQARPAWKPMHRQPVFAQAEYVEGTGVADDLFARGICLPSGSGLTDRDVERVVAAVRTVLATS